MVPFDSPEDAKIYADEALARMSALGLTPYPDNFRLWFNYCNGRDPELRAAVDEAIRSDEPFDNGRCLEICERFFGTRERDSALYTTSEHIGAAVGRILDRVSQIGSNAEGYGKTLAGYSRRLASGGSADEIRTLVAEIATETTKVVQRNHELERRLCESSEEIAELKANLVKVRTETLTDSLTGIGNRRGFEQELQARAIEATEEDLPLSLLLLDIDFFKRFNDFFGHMMGDQVLKLVAESLIKSIKGRDHASRYGGEEFAIILPMTPLASACVVAEQIRKLIGTKNIVKKATGEILCKISVSIGAAEFRPGEPLDALVRRVDAALYDAKSDGRDRVAAEKPEPAADPGAPVDQEERSGWF